MMMVAQHPHIHEVTLAPGEFFFGGGHHRVHTLLGSCVAITLWHPQRHIGGMCHFLLPTRGLNQRLSQGHYADEAVELFLHEIRKSHTRAQDYEVKIFGGGNMFAALGQQASILNVPQNNVQSAARLLSQHHFQVKATDVGGSRHRKIYLELWNGDVWVQRGGGNGR